MLALVATACTTPGAPIHVLLDLPGGELDPAGFTSLELRVRGEGFDVQRNVPLLDGAFDLGTIEPASGVTLDVVLRDANGSLVGYGRTAAATDLVPGEDVVVPVRRPIVYFAGPTVADADGDPATTGDRSWSTRPPAYLDLTSAAQFDGTSRLSATAVLVASAAQRVVVFDQAVMSPQGTLIGPARMSFVSDVDHALVATTISIEGSVFDAAASDDGTYLVVATSQFLYLIDLVTETVTTIAPGRFERVAVIGSTPAVTAVAITNRTNGGSNCAATSELMWLDGTTLTPVASGSFSDVAAADGQAYFVDACGGRFGGVTPAGAEVLRTDVGRPTVVAVADGKAWMGVEKQGQAASLGLVSLALDGSAPPRVVFEAPLTESVVATNYPGVERRLDATAVAFTGLELGAGGRYVALSFRATHDGPAVQEANFPEMTVDSHQLQIIDASSGAPLERYRSSCTGLLRIVDPFFDIYPWECVKRGDATSPVDPTHEHHIGSLAVTFGMK